jgi:hypothetical protein
MGIKSAFSRISLNPRRPRIRVIGGRSTTMSRPYAVQEELQQYGGKALSPQTETVTYRCRVYRFRCDGLGDDEFLYTMVSDTLEDPAKRLPPGEELFGFCGPSIESVREQMKSDRQKLGAVEITSWQTFGSL